jgi:hypothetical protein
VEREQIGWWFIGTDEVLGSDNPYDRFVHISDVDDENPLNPAFASWCIPLYVDNSQSGRRDG